ncbi:unnamed protein product [Alternaria alternata]
MRSMQNSQRHPGATKCLNCARRNEVCNFSPVRIRKRRYASSSQQESVIGSAKKVDSELRDESEIHHDDHSSFGGMSKYDGLQELYVDRLLSAPDQDNALSAQSPSLQDLGVFGSEYSLTFFPEARLKELAIRLGHDRVSHARAKVTNIIGERMKTIERVPAPAPDSDRIRVFDIEEEYIATCIQANLALLDVGCGHFSGLEYASQGTLPGSIASEFTQIARTYVRAQNDSEKNSRPKSSPMYAGGVAPIEGLQETTVAEVSSAFPSYADLQPFPLGWNLRNDGGTMLDGESLDLFGSYYPLWDEGAAYNTMNL